MGNWDELSGSVASRTDEAYDRLVDAWEYGSGSSQMRDFADWLEELQRDVTELAEEGWIHNNVYNLLFEACADILDRDDIDHDLHIKYIVRIRYTLEPKGDWDDWPCDITGMEESVDEEMFEFDDL